MQERDTTEQARYIFRVGKLLQHHIFSTFAQLSAEKQDGNEMELSVSQFKLLMMVRHHGEVTLKELAQRLGVSPPSVSVMVDKLVDRKLLTREQSQQDRRKVVIQVSPDEKTCLDAMEEKVLHAFTKLLDEVGPDIASKWEEVLVKVEQVLSDRQQGK